MSERVVFCIVVMAVAIVAAAVALNDYGKVRIAMEHGYCQQRFPSGADVWVKCEAAK